MAGTIDASPKEVLYQLEGKILQSDGKPFPQITPHIFLHGAITPFVAQTPAGPDGKFKFKRLQMGTYTLIVTVPRVGGLHKTIEVGPSFADSKRRVLVTVQFDQNAPIEKIHGISAVELSVPDSARQEYQRAQNFLARNDIKSATAALQKAVEIAPQFSTAWNHLGTIAYQSRQYVRAEECFREALKQEPTAYWPLVNLGGALLSLDKFQESLAINLLAVKARPGDPLANSQLGQSYYYLNQLEEAERYLKQAKILDPSHFSFPQLVLAELYSRKRDIPAMIRELEEFIKLHPDSDLAPGVHRALEQTRGQGVPRR
jgi:predicted Zn-dependent protease